jgi:CcmD family protein
MKNIILQTQVSADMPNAAGDGKVMVVAVVMAIIFIGIVAYLVYLDRRLTNAENK